MPQIFPYNYKTMHTLMLHENHLQHVVILIKRYQRQLTMSVPPYISQPFPNTCAQRMNIVYTLNIRCHFTHSTLLLSLFRTACNRTLYGETGKTYDIEIRKPKALPFVCHLNFTAPGGPYGDIIQVSLHARARAKHYAHYPWNTILCTCMFRSVCVTRWNMSCHPPFKSVCF